MGRWFALCGRFSPRRPGAVPVGIAFLAALLVGGAARAQLVTDPPPDSTLTADPTEANGVSKPLSVAMWGTGFPRVLIKAITVSKGDPGNPLASSDFAVTDAKGQALAFPLEIAEGVTRSVQVVFKPTAPMKYDGFLVIQPDDAMDPKLLPVKLLLSGVGLAPSIQCMAAAPDNSLSFGPVALGSTSAPASITIVNGGTSAQPLAFRTGASQFHLDRTVATVPSMGKLTLAVTFSPDAATPYTDAVTVALANTTATLCSIPLKGEGQGAAAGDLGAGGDGPRAAPGGGGSCAVGGGRAGPPAPALLLLLFVVAARRVGAGRRPQ